MGESEKRGEGRVLERLQFYLFSQSLNRTLPHLSTRTNTHIFTLSTHGSYFDTLICWWEDRPEYSTCYRKSKDLGCFTLQKKKSVKKCLKPRRTLGQNLKKKTIFDIFAFIGVEKSMRLLPKIIQQKSFFLCERPDQK